MGWRRETGRTATKRVHVVILELVESRTVRICPECRGELKHVDGWEASSYERAGNPLEVDVFVCRGCGVHYRHSVDERFSGDIHTWWRKVDEADEWEILEESEWPT